MNLQDEKTRFSNKLDQLQLAITEVENDFNFKMLQNADPASATGKKLAREVLAPLDKWRGFYNTLLKVLTRAEEYQNNGLTTDALSELTGVRTGLGNQSAMNLLDDIILKVIPSKADILDILAEISDAMTIVSTVFQDLRQPLEMAMRQHSYALSVVPEAAEVMDILKNSEATLLADPVGFKPDSSGISKLREQVRRVVAELEETGKKLADVPTLKEKCTQLLTELQQQLSQAQKAVKGVGVVTAELPTVLEYTELYKRGKSTLTALDSGQIAEINSALQWQVDAHRFLERIAVVLTGIEVSQTKLGQIRSKFRTLRETRTQYGLDQDAELTRLEAEARTTLSQEPVDVAKFEQLVASFSSRIRDLRNGFG